MEILTKSEVDLRGEEILQRIYEGEVFIHPTDTIYGLGCNALHDEAVKKLRKLKDRAHAPFSIWVPNKQWVHDHCVVTDEVEAWMDKLPGAHTIVVQLRDKKAISKFVTHGKDSVGIRLPKHWFHDLVGHLKFPIVTTSANRSGQMFMTSLEDLDDVIKNGVRFCVYEGEKKGKPSRIIHVEQARILRE